MNTKLTIKWLLVTILGVVFWSSCSQDEMSHSTEQDVPEISVVSMAEYADVPSVRSLIGDKDISNMQVLKFKDQATFDKYYFKLDKLSDAERMEFFNKLNFDGAYTEWSKAMDEVDALLDIEDSVALDRAMLAFKAKYASSFAFNTDDEHDVTPNTKMKDRKMLLLGNKLGGVVISSNYQYPPDLIPVPNRPQFPYAIPENSQAPLTHEAMLAIPATPHERVKPPYLEKYSKEDQFYIRKGKKYKASAVLEISRNGYSFLHFYTGKKQFAWRTAVKDIYYVEVRGAVNVQEFTPNYIRTEWLEKPYAYICTKMFHDHVGRRSSLMLRNFTSSRCFGVVGNGDIHFVFKPNPPRI